MKKGINLTLLVLLVTVLAVLEVFIVYKKRSLEALKNNIGIEYSNSTQNNVFVATYPNVMLTTLWDAYKGKIQKDGRTIDRSRNYLTTSEGQSYSLLRAVWMDDKEIFDRVFKWTKNNLQKRPQDKLFAWKWGEDPQGRWDVLVEDGGANTASDADQDIALALIFASKRWDQDHYLSEAKSILADIWKQEVLELNGKYYLLAGNWAKNEPLPTINPSYFSPAAYPIFAKIDVDHPWLLLRDTSYEVLEKATSSPLGSDKSGNLPPDWVSINPETGELIPSVHADKTSNFADDAFRVVWRVGLDWQWHKNQQAKNYLETLALLKTEWTANGKISAVYKHTGEKESDYESYSTYGGILPYFVVAQPNTAREVYVTKLVGLYDPDTEDFRQDLGYYAQNWVWFGMAFYENKLLNLYGDVNGQ